ncbi:hypothetical protein Plhal304r1_c017g0062181 [Plasmopara halstedii]
MRRDVDFGCIRRAAKGIKYTAVSPLPPTYRQKLFLYSIPCAFSMISVHALRNPG